MSRPIFEFHYWGYPIYFIMMLTGFAFALWNLSRVHKEIGSPGEFSKKVNRTFIIAAFIAMATANIINWFLFPELLSLPLSRRISEAGFTFYYGMLGFFAASALLFRLQKINPAVWVNHIVPSVLLAHAFGRVGCSLGGCCYGVPVSAFGKSFDFPAREIEAVCLFALFFVFKNKIKKHRLPIYFLVYGILRFFIEFGRGDDRGTLLVHWLSPSQVTSALLVTGVGVFILVRKKHKQTH